MYDPTSYVMFNFIIDIGFYREGFQKKYKKIMDNSIKGPDPPSPPIMEKKYSIFFLKLDHSLRNFFEPFP